jgi:hypothetical protein
MGKIKKSCRYPEILLAIDLLAFWYFGRLRELVFVFTVLSIIQIICKIDKMLLPHKK